MISVTMNQIIDFRNSGDFFDGTNLPLKAAYKLNKIRKAVEKESEFYSEKFQEILNDYAKKDENGELVFSEDGDQIMIKDDMIDECNKALTDLQNLEVQIENYGLSIDDFGEDLECTPDQLSALMPFME
jgi:hypothetical protein